jgi:hypothetical protein
MALPRFSRRLLLTAASYGIVFAAGFSLAWYSAAWIAFAAAFRSDVLDTDRAAFQMESTLQSGADDAKTDALRNYLAFLNRQSQRDLHSFGTLVASDEALSYARLAMLAQGRGDATQARAYLDKAASYCAHMKWKECNSEKLLKYAGWMNHQ